LLRFLAYGDNAAEIPEPVAGQFTKPFTINTT